MSAGFELLDRLTVGVTLPGHVDPVGESAGTIQVRSSGNVAHTTFSTGGPAVADMRLDGRYVVWRSLEGDKAVGVQLSVRIPTGNGSSSNFGGDGAFSAAADGDRRMDAAPTCRSRSSRTSASTSVTTTRSTTPPGPSPGPRRGSGSATSCAGRSAPSSRSASGKFRLGATIFGQTGLTSDDTTGPTFFTAQNTPIEWNVEGRMKLPIKGRPVVRGRERRHAHPAGLRRAGPAHRGARRDVLADRGHQPALARGARPGPREHSRVAQGHRRRRHPGRHRRLPDRARGPQGSGSERRLPRAERPRRRRHPGPVRQVPGRARGQGRHPGPGRLPRGRRRQRTASPTRRTPARRSPAQPDPDPKKNGCPKFIKLEGSIVRVLQQVHFATGSATILPDSFPMLGEIVALLKANPSIKKMRIEGHTDNRGNADFNLDLSKRRAASVRTWLVAARHRGRPARERRLRPDQAHRVQRHRRGAPREPARRVQDPRGRQRRRRSPTGLEQAPPSGAGANGSRSAATRW